jgi:hypothetical protein
MHDATAVTEAVQGSLLARHGFTSHAVLTLSASLVSAKASMKDAKGALRHASTVLSWPILLRENV